MRKLALRLLALAGGGALALNVPPSTKLQRVPFIMSHDTATGYLGELNRLYEHSPTPEEILIGWTKTQVGSVTDQINCGARAFDMRPYLAEKEGLIAHHGGILVLHPFKDMMQEMVDWANANPDEFLLPEIAHCSGDTPELKKECDFAARDVLKELGIPFVFNDTCPDAIQEMTLGQAMDKGQLEGGGHVLAVWGGCFESNYDATRNCRGYEYESAGVSRKYNCWINGSNPDYAVNRIMEYMDETYQAGPPENGKLWQMQALWQAVEGSISLGTTGGASLLIDEKYSRLNRFMFENLTKGRWGEPGLDGVNMFEVDFVCDQGDLILMALDPLFNGNWSAFPDDVIINDTGISHSILAGEPVIFYVTPADYISPTFKDSKAIRNRHRHARWGQTNDIVEFFNGDEEKQNEYLAGILGTSILLWCIFMVWAIILLWAKWSNKLKWMSGVPPAAPTIKSVDRGEEESASEEQNIESAPEQQANDDVVVEDPQARKYRLRVRRIRITVLCCGFLILLFSGLLIGLGFSDLANAIDSSGESLDKVQDLVTEASEVANDYLIQANQTSEARVNFLNALVFNCNLTGQVVDNITGLPVSEGVDNATADLIELNNTLDNFTTLYEKIDSINGSLYSLNSDLDSVQGSVDDMATSVLFPVAIAFIGLVDVVVIVFMVGLFLAWRKKQPRLFYDCTSKVALPLFLLLLLCAFVVSTLALVGATFAADFCIETPDNQILGIINASAPFDEFLEYFIRGCDPDKKPDLLSDFFKIVEFVLIGIHDVLTELSQLDPSEVPCNNTELVQGALGALKEEYEAYVELLYRLGVALGCDRLNTIYALLAYKTGCVSGFDSLSQIFAYLFLIALCSMTIVTLRVAWYETDDAADERALHAKDEEENQGEVDEDHSEVSSSPYEEDDGQPEVSCDPVTSMDTADEAIDRYESQDSSPVNQVTEDKPVEDKNVATGIVMDKADLCCVNSYI